MSNSYSNEFIASANLICELAGAEMRLWAKDDTNPELKKACVMVLSAAGQGAQK